MAENLNDADAMEMVKRVFHFFESSNSPPKVRLGRVIDKMGIDEFKKSVGV
jgi:dissimilatory sulfite reductase (desulfoviridin) alpha/beta subunit